VHNRHPYARGRQKRTRLRRHQTYRRRGCSDLGRSSTAATNVTYAVVIATSTWSSTCAVNADPGATPHLYLIQMNCNISSYEAPQNSVTRVTGKGYFRGPARNQYSVNSVSSVSRNYSAISL
jgi:hypothetical protein